MQSQATDYQTKLEEAKSQIVEEKSFYSHLITFAIVVTGIVIFNLWTGGYFWAGWVIFGWGIGILSHASSTFGRHLRFAKKWEERRLKTLMDEE